MATKAKKHADTAAEAAESADAAAAPVFHALDIDGLAALGRDNVAAMTESNRVLCTGLAEIGDELLGYARHALECASQAASALIAARTLDEVMQVQAEAARTNMAAWFEGSTKLAERSVSLAGATLAPLEGRVEAAFKRAA